MQDTYELVKAGCRGKMSVEQRTKTRSKANTVHYAAETGDIKLLEHFVREGMASGNPESVTLQQREDVLGMMPLHIAAENGEVEAVEVGWGRMAVLVCLPPCCTPCGMSLATPAVPDQKAR